MPTKESERAMRWALAHPEQIRKSRERYAKRHAARITATRKARAQTAAFKAANIAAQNRFNAANPWYKSYQSARRRCLRPSDPGFKYYGGRGIRFLLSVEEVRDMWFRDNAASLARPSIDRVDSAKDYVLSNCRFIEAVENAKQGLRVSHARRAQLKMSTVSPSDFTEA